MSRGRSSALKRDREQRKAQRLAIKKTKREERKSTETEPGSDVVEGGLAYINELLKDEEEPPTTDK